MISPSRALEDKSGDQQARAELLGKVLCAAGEQPYMLKHGVERDAYFIVMVPFTDLEAMKLQKETGKSPVVIKVGKRTLVALQLEADVAAGQILPTFYDAEHKRWTSTIALTRFQ